MERLNAIEPAPEYTLSKEFQDFLKEQRITVNAKYGYMFAHLYKPFYFPGEIVRGSIILDFFNDLPTTYKKVMLRLKGEEYVNKHHDKVKVALTKAQNIAKLNRSRSSIQTTSNIEGPKEIKETKIGSNFK